MFSIGANLTQIEYRFGFGSLGGHNIAWKSQSDIEARPRQIELGLAVGYFLLVDLHLLQTLYQQIKRLFDLEDRIVLYSVEILRGRFLQCGTLPHQIKRVIEIKNELSQRGLT